MSDTCKAPLNIKGEAFICDREKDHAPPHGSTEAGAIWADAWTEEPE